MIGNGTVHHIAFSTSSDANQKIIMESIIKKA